MKLSCARCGGFFLTLAALLRLKKIILGENPSRGSGEPHEINYEPIIRT